MKKWLLAVVIGCFLTFPALSGDVQATRDKLISDFKDCAWQAFNSADKLTNPNLVAEASFLACSTEEQAIRAFLVLLQFQPAIARSIIVRIKLDEKKNLIQWGAVLNSLKAKGK
jgi:hypothetical protein